MSQAPREPRPPRLRRALVAVALGLALGAPLRAQAPAVELLDALAAAGGAAERDAALVELARLPRRDLVAALEGIAREPASDATRAGALTALGVLGGAQDVRLLGRLTADPVEGSAVATARPTLRGPYAEALAGLLRREPDALWNLADAFGTAPAGIGARIVECVADAPSTARADVLSRMLGARAEIDCQVLGALERVAREERTVEDGVVRRVRARLSSPDARTRQAAALALGALGDAQSIAELIELCAEPGGFPSSGARQALREITGLAHDTAEAWRTWHAREEAWWLRTAPADLAELAGGTPERTAEVLLDLSRRRLHRDEIARAVAACLRRDEPDLAVLACAVLQSLGSEAVRDDLERALRRDEPSVRAAARSALHALGEPERGAARPGRGDG